MAERRGAPALAALLGSLACLACPPRASAAESKPDDRVVCVPAADGRNWDCGTPEHPPEARPVPRKQAPTPPIFLMDPNARGPAVMRAPAAAAPAETPVAPSPAPTPAAPSTSPPAASAAPRPARPEPAPVAAPVTPVAAPEPPLVEAPAAPAASSQPKPVEAPTPVAAPAPAPAEEPPTPAAAPEPPPVEAPPAPEPTQIETAPAPVAAPEPAPVVAPPAPEPTSAETRGAPVAAPAEPVDAPAPAAPEPATHAPTATPAAEHRAAPREATAFLALKSGGYTVQLARADRADAFSALAAELGLDPGELYAVAWDQAGRRTWLLFWGEFADAASAQAAVARLPGHERLVGAWPRRIKAMQDELRPAGAKERQP